MIYFSSKKYCFSLELSFYPIKKLFIEKKIPLSERELIFVVADDTGVLFVEGFGADERVLNDPDDERIAVAVKNI